MPNTKISNLTSAGTLTGSEVLPIVQSGTTVKVSTQNVANLAISYKSFSYKVSATFGSATFTELYNDTSATITPNLNGGTFNFEFAASSAIYTNKTFLQSAIIKTNNIDPILSLIPIINSTTLVSFQPNDYNGNTVIPMYSTTYDFFIEVKIFN